MFDIKQYCLVGTFGMLILAGALESTADQQRDGVQNRIQTLIAEGEALIGQHPLLGPGSVPKFRQAVRLARQIGDRTAEAEARVGLGRGHVPDRFEALAHLELALNIYRGTGDRAGQARVLHLLGVAYSHYRLRDTQKSLSHLEQALSLRRDLGDDRALAETLERLGAIQRQRGFVEKASSYFEEALILRRSAGPPMAEARARLQLADLSYELGRYDEATPSSVCRRYSRRPRNRRGRAREDS